MKTLKEFREAIGKTKQEMANEIGISYSMYDQLERGKRKAGRELIEKIKKTYPILDIYIFLDLNHTKCDID